MIKYILINLIIISTSSFFVACSIKKNSKENKILDIKKSLIVDGITQRCLTYRDGLVVSKCYSTDTENQEFEPVLYKANNYQLKFKEKCLTIDYDYTSFNLKECEPNNTMQLFSFNELSHGQFYRQVIKNNFTNKCVYADPQNGIATMSSCYTEQNLLYRPGTMFQIRESYPSLLFDRPMKEIPSARKIKKAQINVIEKNKNKKLTNVFILFTDTLRGDKITEDLAPNLYQFKKESIQFNKIIAGASATHHSLFSSFYGRTSLDKDEFFNNMNWEEGSPLLEILVQLGFKTSFHSPSSLMFCPGHGGETSVEYNFNQILFGINGHLRSDCKKQADIDKNKWRVSDNNYSRADEYSLSKFQESLLQYEQKDNQYSFSFTYLFSNHAPYSWLSQEESPLLGVQNVNTNSFDPNRDISAYDTVKNTMNKKIQSTFINSYNNSVTYTDNVFKEFSSTLKDKNLYDDSIVVFFSDHGEDLFENGNYLEHGGPNYESRINIPIFIKPPKSFNTNKQFKKIASSYDLFPILFDLLGIDYSSLSSYLIGDSGLHNDNKKDDDCVISVSPNGYAHHADQFTFVNSSYKIYLQLDQIKRPLKEQRPDIKKINIFGIENTSNKKKVEIPKHKIHDFININFSSCIKKLFPSNTHFKVQ